METYFTKVASNPGINTVPENPCKLIGFEHLVLGDGASYSGSTGDREVLLVILGGRATVTATNASSSETFANIGKRANPFGGKPWSVYLPAGTDFSVTAHGNLDAGLCSAPSTLATKPYVISPDLLEALVAGLPVLATAVCGYAHYIAEADGGLVIPDPFEQMRLNAMLAEMLDDKNGRMRWQTNALAFAQTADIYSNAERAADLILNVRQ